MRLTKAEINMRRLLRAMPNQTDQTKLAQYIVTLKEQLALLTGETGQGNLSCISEEKVKHYAEEIEMASSRINSEESDNIWDTIALKGVQMVDAQKPKEGLAANVSEDGMIASTGIRRRAGLNARSEKNSDNRSKHESSASPSVKLHPAKQEHIEKHRHLQEDLTDDLVIFARQMKENSLLMNQKVLDSRKTLDSAGQEVERSLAATKQVNVRAQAIYSQSFKTGCCTWLIMFVMCCMFLLAVFLIRIT